MEGGLNQNTYFQDVCRACLISNRNFISIFSCDRRFKKTYAEMLMEITPVMITLDQHLTSNVCSICADSICTSYNFRQQCIQADTIIHGGFKAINSTSNVNIFIKHETYDDKSLNNCYESIELITKSPDVISKSEIYDSLESNPESIDTSNEMIVEASNVENNIYDPLEFNTKTSSKEEIIATKDIIEKQQPYNHKSSYDKVRRQLIRAAIAEHSKGKPNHCITCNKIFSVTKYFRGHIINKHVDEPVKPVSCDSCGKFISKKNFPRHKNKCVGIKQKIRSSKLKTEILCNVCGCKFKYLSFKNHVRLHTGEKPYKCKYCTKKFRQLPHVKAHERLHTGEKPFKCNYCAKSFRHPNTCTDHMRTHTGEKPFKCKICERGFTHLPNLRKHVLNHK